ncbi:F-box/kelch-repeat protein At3g23880-like [Cornus florida]|uniref:F-box/kelch-repeat protein At3g23880-like n=1 Tax=Cornus florida TaxID=4283 RepID=UPI00289E2A69|nr:F-box/kelch-repeat protein At3g23880-like [Cornus florida]
MGSSKESLQVSMESIKREAMTSCGDINRLPGDIMIDILSRLPVKFVIRGSAVCKNWHSMVKTPSFVCKYFNHCTNSIRLFVYHFDAHAGSFYFSIYDDETLAGSPPAYRDVVVDMPHHLEMSLYDGIFCMSNRSSRCALWNQATREFRALPILPEVLGRCVMDTFGFGLDPTTQDYKVVLIWVTVDEYEEKRWLAAKTAVYTLSSDSWRDLDVSIPCPWIFPPVSNTCIDGVFHWFGVDNERKPLILSFDMGSDSFGEIRGGFPRPNCASLTTCNKSLALCYYDIADMSISSVDVWVRNWDESWTMHARVEIPYITVLGFWKEGMIFMKTDEDRHLALYNPETQEVKNLGYRTGPHPFLYRESLVAIRRRNGIIEQHQTTDVAQILDFCE